MGFSEGVIFECRVLLFANNAHTCKKVCSNDFNSHDARLACISFGYVDGSYEIITQNHWSESQVPVFKTDSSCKIYTNNFLDCSHSRDYFCGRSDNVLLNCYSG